MIKIKRGSISESREVGELPNYSIREDKPKLRALGMVSMSVSLELTYDQDSQGRILINCMRDAINAVIDNAIDDSSRQTGAVKKSPDKEEVLEEDE